MRFILVFLSLLGKRQMRSKSNPYRLSQKSYYERPDCDCIVSRFIRIKLSDTKCNIENILAAPPPLCCRDDITLNSLWMQSGHMDTQTDIHAQNYCILRVRHAPLHGGWGIMSLHNGSVQTHEPTDKHSTLTHILIFLVLICHAPLTPGSFR